MVETALVNDPVIAAVATLIFKDNKLLLGRRVINNQFICWQCPGGYILKTESTEAAAKRLCLEKAGLVINGLQQGPATNNIFQNGSHTVTLYLLSDACYIQNKSQFENSQDQWSWFEIDDLPSPLFLPLINLQKQVDFQCLATSIKESTNNATLSYN